MAAHAADAIAAGHADVVLLTYGSTARSDLKKGLRAANLNWGTRGPLQWEAPYGHTLISKYAMAARRHMHEYGTTIEQLAEVAVSARFNAADNPEAFYRDPITIDDVLAGPMIADPFTKLHCCIRSDGGAAVVLVAEDRVADLPKKPVWVLGTGEATTHMSMSQWDDFTTGPAAVSGPLAFERAGVSPADIDVAELYDAFTYMLLITLEDLGFCAKGEGGAFVESGALRLGGALPTNTDGGGLSACHPGQRGLFLLVEAARQLRGECGDAAGARRQARLRQRHRWLVLLQRHDDPRAGTEPYGVGRARLRRCVGEFAHAGRGAGAPRPSSTAIARPTSSGGAADHLRRVDRARRAVGASARRARASARATSWR